MRRQAKKPVAAQPLKLDKESVETVVAGTSIICRLLDISGVTFHNYRKRGVFKDMRGDIPVLECVHAFIHEQRRLHAETKKTKGGGMQMVHEAKAKELLLKYAERSGQVVELQGVVDTYSEIVGAFKSRLLGLAARITDDPTLRDKIEREVDATLTELADDSEQAADAIEAASKAASSGTEMRA